MFSLLLRFSFRLYIYVCVCVGGRGGGGGEVGWRRGMGVRIARFRPSFPVVATNLLYRRHFPLLKEFHHALMVISGLKRTSICLKLSTSSTHSERLLFSYNGYNHKNYNFLACDWFKKVLFSTNPLAKLLSDSLLLDSLLLDSLLSDSSIGQSHSKM